MHRKVEIGEIGTHIGALIAIIILTAVIGGLASTLPGNIGIAIAVIVCILGIGCIFIFPILIAADVSNRIPEVRNLFLVKPELKCFKIRHQYFPIIILITLIFGATGIGYLVAFIWALTPGNVMIPDEIVSELNNLKSENRTTGSSTSSPQVPPPICELAPPSPSGTRAYPVGKEIHFRLIHNDQQLGPFDLATLQQMHRGGILLASSMVWQKGMQDWQVASTVPELAVLLQAQSGAQ